MISPYFLGEQCSKSLLVDDYRLTKRYSKNRRGVLLEECDWNNLLNVYVYVYIILTIIILIVMSTTIILIPIK